MPRRQRQSRRETRAKGEEGNEIAAHQRTVLKLHATADEAANVTAERTIGRT